MLLPSRKELQTGNCHSFSKSCACCLLHIPGQHGRVASLLEQEKDQKGKGNLELRVGNPHHFVLEGENAGDGSQAEELAGTVYAIGVHLGHS